MSTVTRPSGRAVDALRNIRITRDYTKHAEGSVLIECGGDILGANVPVFLERLKKARQVDKLVLVAPDSLAAFGGLRILEKMGFAADLLTGPCTDTPTLLERTQKLCGVKAINMLGPRP